MKFKKLLIIGTLTAAITGCGGDGGGLSASGDASSILANIQGTITNQFLTAVQAQAGTVPAPPAGMPSFIPSPWDTCAAYTIGTANTDAHFKIEYNCNKVSDGTNNHDWLGFFEQKYTDPAKDPMKGFHQEMDITHVFYNTPSDFSRFQDRGYFDYQVKSGSFIYESDFESLSYMPSHNPPVDWSWRSAKKTTYTPTDMNNPSQAGAVSHEGHFQIKGLLGGTGPGTPNPEISITFEISSKDLTYDGSGGCGTYYNKGSVLLTDGSGNKLEVRFHPDCTTVKYYFNGKEVF